MTGVIVRHRVSGLPPALALAVGALMMVAALGGIATTRLSAAPHSSSRQLSSATAYAALPLSFAPNRGQAASGTDFVANASGLHEMLSASGATMAVRGHTIAMQLANANPTALPAAGSPLPGHASYLLGTDSAHWVTNVPTFARVSYHNVYPGVDIAYHGTQQQVEYDFTLAPGADPASIALTFAGVRGVALDSHGDLVLDTPGGTIVQQRPHLYQAVNGATHDVSGGFVVSGDGTVGFAVGPYDHSLPLVIDPTIVYSTYLGGSGNEEGGYSIAVDSAGNAYVAGGTANPGQGGGSTDFPVTAGAFQTAAGGGSSDGAGDAYVSKLSADGSSLIYSTYIGGSGFDDADGIAIDGNGDAYVRGATMSSDFPTTSDAFQTQQPSPTINVWTAKLSPDGTSLLYCTYLGGHGFTSGSGIAIDGSDSAYLTGITGAPDFPTTPGAFDRNFHGKANLAPPPFSPRPDEYDAFVTKLTPDGSSLEYSTFLGGNRLDAGFGIAVDRHGNAFVSGDTRSPSFPATPHAVDKSFNGQTDAFVAEVNPYGSDLVYATFLGGRGFDEGIAIALDAADNAYVTGSTASADFPTTPRAYQTTFASTLAPPSQPCTPLSPPPCGPRNTYVAKISADGSTLRYSTFLGGSVFDFGSSIAVDTAGAAYITGGTFSPDFPTTAGAPQGTIGGSQDAFVSELSPDGSSLAASTFLGGSDFDQGVGIAVPAAGDVYVTGATSSTDFPVTPGAFQTTLHGAANGFVTHLSGFAGAGGDG